MLSKKKKQSRATLLIILLVGALLYLQQGPGGRSGFPESFNTWYESNSNLAIWLIVGMIFFLVIWGFYESKTDKTIKLAKLQSRMQREQQRAEIIERALK